MTQSTWTATTVCALALVTAGFARAEKPSPLPSKGEVIEEFEQEHRFGDDYRRDFIRGGHVNVGIIFGRDRSRRRGPDAYPYPDRYPSRGCVDCEYDSHQDDWYREESKRRAEWEREEAKRIAEHEREAAKRYYEQEREASKRYYEQERERDKRYYERRREDEKRFREHGRGGYER